MIEFIIVVSFVIVILCYYFVSIKDNSYINVLTPSYFILIPSNYILELIHIHYNGYSGSVYAYWYCYLVYAVSSISFTFFYVKTKITVPRRPIKIKNYNYILIPYYFLILGVILYLPILLEYKEYILTPRFIYTQTRTGYGFNYFLSSFLMYLFFIVFLFKEKKLFYEVSFVIIMCFLMAYVHGSKTQILTFIFIYALYQSYINNIKVTFTLFSIISISLSCLMIFLFYIFSINYDIFEMIKYISSYSDYTRNAMMVIDSNFPTQYGKLSIFGEIYARVPRLLLPSKPKCFGEFFLAKEFYPERYYLDEGSPSFGIGLSYADFGIFSIFIIIIFSIINAVLLKNYVNRLKVYKYPGDFIIVLFLSGLSLIPLGAGFLLPEHLVIALFITFIMRIKQLKNRNIIRTILYGQT